MTYKELSDNSRVWIYQSDREFTSEEIAKIRLSGQEFIQSWDSHGASLFAAFEIFYQRFIVFFVDENQAKASGCSIDKSIHFIKQIETDFKLSLFNRTLLAYRNENKISIVRLQELEKTFKEIFKEKWMDVIVFNNLVSTKKEFESGWETPLKKSWIMDKTILN